MSHSKYCQIGKIGSMDEFPQDEACIRKVKHSIVFKSTDLSQCSKYIVRLCDEHFYRFYQMDEFGVPSSEQSQSGKGTLRFTFRENRV